MEKKEIMDKRELKTLLLFLLKLFNQVCETAHIPCYASAGTLLGAVRHKGLIPWDDDIDFMIPRQYYDQFVDACESILKEPVILQTRENDPDAVIEYIKMGFQDDIKGFSDVSIDVFFLDETDPSRKLFRAFQNRIKLDLYYIKVYKVRKSTDNPYTPKNFFKRLYLWVGSMVPNSTIDKLSKRIMTAEKKSTDYWVNWGSCYSYKKSTYKKEWFGAPQKLPFENTYIWAAQHPGQILEHLYGPNYMTPPPPEKRVDHGVGRLHCAILDIERIKDTIM